MFLLLALFGLLVLPSPWSVVAFAACLLLGVVEVLFWHRRVRVLRVREKPIGELATVVAACRPLGRVAVGGELWAARCVSGADPDEIVTVVGRENLVLLVEPNGTPKD